MTWVDWTLAREIVEEQYGSLRAAHIEDMLKAEGLLQPGRPPAPTVAPAGEVAPNGRGVQLAHPGACVRWNERRLELAVSLPGGAVVAVPLGVLAAFGVTQATVKLAMDGYRARHGMACQVLEAERVREQKRRAYLAAKAAQAESKALARALDPDGAA